jgi:hypothetical protein
MSVPFFLVSLFVTILKGLDPREDFLVLFQDLVSPKMGGYPFSRAWVAYHEAFGSSADPIGPI